MQLPVPLTPSHAQLSILPLAAGSPALSAREDSLASRAGASVRTPSGLLCLSLSGRRISASAVCSGGNFPSNEESNPLWYEHWRGLFFPGLLSSLTLKEFATLCFVGP